MRDDRARRAGLDEERKQFRLLFRTFLRRLFHSDLVRPRVRPARSIATPL